MLWMRNIAIISLILVVAACAPQDPRDANNPQVYRTGWQGLELSFIEGFPPEKIFDDEFQSGESDYEIALEVQNAGAFDVSDDQAEFYLSGYDKNIIQGVRGKQLSSSTGKRAANTESIYTLLPKQLLEGKSFSNPQGGLEIIEFEGGNVLDLNSRNIEQYSPTLLVTACYRYQTLASASVCIDPKPFTTPDQNRACTPGSIGLGDQGAPIAVAAIDTEARPGKTRFTITIQNVGTGDVFIQENTLSARDKCDPTHDDGLRFNDLNKVIPSITVGTTQLSDANCRPLNEETQLRLSNGLATLVCEFDTASLGNTPYEAPITIQLDYNYRMSTSRQVEILQGFE